MPVNGRVVLLLLQSNALYEGRYLLGTSLARPCIAKRQVGRTLKLPLPAARHTRGNRGLVGGRRRRLRLCLLAC